MLIKGKRLQQGLRETTNCRILLQSIEDSLGIHHQ